MGKNRYSEEEAVQKPVGELLHKMGWELVYAYDNEELGQHGTLGRNSYHEVVLRRYLVDALVELNEWLEVEECEQAADALMATLTTDTLPKEDIKKVKSLCVELVETVRKRLSQMSHWTEKPETLAEMDTLIRDELYKLPEQSYPNDSITEYRAQIFDYFYSRAA